jgi:acyl-CoA synthetase (AMP-forming)/AMP-acid ligase II
MPEFEIPEMRIDEFIWQNFSHWNRKVATVCGITGRQYTYGQLRDKSRILAIRLHKNFNLHIGDKIAICLPNCPEYPIIVLAGLEAGMVITTINPLYNAGNLINHIKCNKLVNR